ncbi:metal-dependent hydrolase [Polaribacter gochangensis]|uniref:metal-dependent hydrolase n=1 Tax=Polaribacter gochangensis TaxID=3252903 RepID=UPI003904DD4C
MKITFYGHSCFGIEINNIHIVVDPFITGNPKASHLDVDSLKADYILVTHAHQDHVLDVEKIAHNTGAIILSNFEIVNYFMAKKLKGFHLNHGGTFKTEDFSAKYVNAIHTSSFADGTYGGQPGGFIFTANNTSIYIAGDTALTFDMKLIPMFSKLTAAILPIGDTFTMGIEEAIVASDFIECNKIIGCHFDTFPPIEINQEEAKKLFKSKSKELILLEIGSSIEL